MCVDFSLRPGTVLQHQEKLTFVKVTERPVGDRRDRPVWSSEI
jgi:hypothetical protein